VTDLVYQRRGAGRPLLLLHGATLDHRMWDPQVAAFADRFEVVTCDLRGYGASPPPTGTFKHCEDVSGLIDELHLDNVIVVGHSIGGLYGLELSLLRPDAVTGFVALCMSGLGQPEFPADVQAMFGEIKTAARTVGVDAAKTIWKQCGWFASARAQPAIAALLDRYLADYSGWYWLHDSPAINLDPPAVTRLEQLAIPTLVIDGMLDLAYNHAIADILAIRIPKTELLRLEGVGHMASLEAPDAVNAAILRLAGR